MKIAEIPSETDRLLPENQDDASDVGINWADAVLKTMKTTLPDGRKVLAKRRGLKITLQVGDKRGEGLLRRLDHGPDVHEILRHALAEAGADAGVEISIRDRAILLNNE